MNTLLLSINWNPNPELFNLFGLSIRYYGLLWAVGIFLAYVIVHYQYRDKKIDEKKFDPLFFYCFFGILIGARLGHCLFYDPGQYLTSGKGFVEMLLPIKFLPAGGWKFTGYEGLASHGGDTWTDYCSVALLPQNKTSLYGRAGYDCRSYSNYRLLYPSCQPDELRNHRQAV